MLRVVFDGLEPLCWRSALHNYGIDTPVVVLCGIRRLVVLVGIDGFHVDISWLVP